MSVGLAITDYNLTLMPQSSSNGSPATVEAAEIAALLHDAVAAGSGGESLRAVSARDQLSVVLRPPAAAVIDHSGAPPARLEMVTATIALIEMFGARGFSVQAYGWNIQGVLSGVDPREAMSRLVDAQQLTEVLGNREKAWSVPQITLSTDAGTAGADRINVTLQIADEPDGQESLRFDANAHYERAPDIVRLGDEGPRVWASINEIISRLPS